ncbi:MAG: hypothetical protein HC792_00320 [Acaryochloridaceae cyanobacterium CSU_5_19]|nr:hypothetical protein [Acaryochloridaceae cyanobacterium CSU_5_19]
MKYPAQGSLIWTWPSLLLSTLILMARPGIAQTTTTVNPPSSPAPALASQADLDRMLKELQTSGRSKRKFALKLSKPLAKPPVYLICF